MTLGLFREDLQMQKDGAPIKAGDSTFYVKRSGTKEYYEKRRSITQKLFGLYLQPKQEDEIKINAYVLAEYLVTGWDDVFTEDGDSVDYSIQAAKEIFLDEEYQLSLNAILINSSWDFGNYLKLKMEEDLQELKKK